MYVVERLFKYCILVVYIYYRWFFIEVFGLKLSSFFFLVIYYYVINNVVILCIDN